MKISAKQIRTIAHKSGLPVELIKYRLSIGYPITRIGEKVYPDA